jgi:hypothetical protein
MLNDHAAELSVKNAVARIVTVEENNSTFSDKLYF